MQDDILRHRDAVQYNVVVAEAAEKVAAELVHPEIKGWATGVGKQHRHHERRHRKALERLESSPEQAATSTDVTDAQEAQA